MIELTIVGRVGADAVVKEVNGRFVMSFSVAHSEKWTDKQGNKQERTTWVSCSQWADKSPGVAPYIKKGGMIYVSGMPSADAYTNNTGEQVATLRLDAKKIELLSSSQQDGQGQQRPQQQQAAPQQQAQYNVNMPAQAHAAQPHPFAAQDDDLPF